MKNDRDRFFESLCVGLLYICLFGLKGDNLIRGDGYEYIAQVEAWLNHQSMDIREEDYLRVSRYYGEEVGQRVRNWFFSLAGINMLRILAVMQHLLQHY